MTFSIYDASAPVFAATLRNMSNWLDKATADGADEGKLMGARLTDDMHPLTRQIQMASDAAKGAVARLARVENPSMPDTEQSFAELKARLQKTIDFVESVDRAKIDGAEDREIELKFPNGMGYRFNGERFLNGFALPNFYFHSTMAYALLRANGAPLGKPDFLAHLGAPNL